MAGVLLIAAVLTSGLVAGLFYSYAISVMPALSGADDGVFVDTMQRINVAILNGWFALAFGGTLVFTAAAVVVHLVVGERRQVPLLVAGLILYVAVLAVTGIVNVPLNNQLALAGRAAAADPAVVRRRFESRWVRWNVVRAVLSTAAFGCLTLALALT